MDYLHGAYSQIQTAGTRVASKSRSAIVYIGTAPVQTLSGGGKNVNRPILVNNIAEARKLFGYSEDWAKYTLCEAMHAHFENNAVGPLVFINVLDPAVHKAEEEGSVSLTPENGQITITNAEDIILDSIQITGKNLGEDYTVQYNLASRLLPFPNSGPGRWAPKRSALPTAASIHPRWTRARSSAPAMARG